jgi:hypothetical protein
MTGDSDRDPSRDEASELDATKEESSGAFPRPFEPPLVRVTTDRPIRCRCGTRVAAGGEVYSISTRRVLAWALLHDQRFCSARCARAHCLELLEQLDAVDTPAARATVSDLHELTQEVSFLFHSL